MNENLIFNPVLNFTFKSHIFFDKMRAVNEKLYGISKGDRLYEGSCY